jgi:hypothetical protein
MVDSLRKNRHAAKALVVVLPFLLLYWADMWHHTMFFDEVNAWAISAASPTLSKLFYYVHFEGHPWLWYFILWFPSRLTHDPVGMKWVEAVLGTAIILIVGLLSPFTYKQRALILCSYFLMWEYTVMCRMYSVMFLLVLLYVVRRVRRPEGVVGCCALLGLAGNTDMTGVLLASALLVEYAYSSYFGVEKEQRGAAVRRWIPGLLVYAALLGLAVGTMWPAKQISWQSSGHMGALAFDRNHIDHSIGNMIAAPWWPISPQFPHHFWETSVTDAKWLYVLVPVVLWVYWKTFRRYPNLLLLMGCTLLFGIVFADVVYVGRVRHWGIAFVAFLVGLWLQSSNRRDGTAEPLRWSTWTYGLLGLSAVAGVIAIGSSWYRPFSRARETAKWIEENVPPGTLVTGAPDVNFASMGEERQRPMYFLECQCVDTFKLFSKGHENFTEDQFPVRVNTALDTQGRESLVFLTYRSLKSDDLQRFSRAHLNVSYLTEFSGADMPNEDYFIYQISRQPK